MSVEQFREIMSNTGAEAPERAAPENKISFTGELGAMFREGLKDLQNAMLPAFPESLRGVEEPGTPLNPTQQMVTEGLNPSNKGGYAPANEVSLKEILDAPSIRPPPTVERDMGREM